MEYYGIHFSLLALRVSNFYFPFSCLHFFHFQIVQQQSISVRFLLPKTKHQTSFGFLMQKPPKQFSPSFDNMKYHMHPFYTSAKENFYSDPIYFHILCILTFFSMFTNPKYRVVSFFIFLSLFFQFHFKKSLKAYACTYIKRNWSNRLFSKNKSSTKINIKVCSVGKWHQFLVQMPMQHVCNLSSEHIAKPLQPQKFCFFTHSYFYIFNHFVSAKWKLLHPIDIPSKLSKKSDYWKDNTLKNVRTSVQNSGTFSFYFGKSSSLFEGANAKIIYYHICFKVNTVIIFSHYPFPFFIHSSHKAR